MDNTKTITFNWDSESKTGNTSLLVKISTIKKYALPPLLQAYNEDIGIINYPYDALRVYEGAKQEIEEYQTISRMHNLSQESEFHSSHILILLIDYMSQKNRIGDGQEVRRILHNRLYLLKRLMNVKDYKDYNINIYNAQGSFKFHFGTEPILKRNVIKYLIGQIKTQLRDHDRKLYNLLMSGASEDELEEAVKRQSEYQINKVLVAQLAKKIVRYLNAETIVMRNTKSIDSLSVSNAQGDFIYDILTHFGIYNPRQANSSTVKHHDAIRKLIKRSAMMDEDKQDLN